MEVFEYDDDIRRTAHAPQEMLSYLYRFSVFVWMRIFSKTVKKNLRF